MSHILDHPLGVRPEVAAEAFTDQFTLGVKEDASKADKGKRYGEKAKNQHLKENLDE
jgi:hypothetical protein